MFDSDIQYSKLRWLLTIAGLILYVSDICIDTGLSVKYFQQGQYIWSGLTVMFVLTGLLVTQIFSYAWYRDDMKDVFQSPDGAAAVSDMSKGGLTALHSFGMGIFFRYYQLLKNGFKVVWMRTNSYTAEEMKDVHHELFCEATDLSMLKLFEAFLESVPQLLLQLYIRLGQDECSVLQHMSLAFSFFNVSWALVDYRRCLRRSLPQISEMPSGLPTVIYLFYKLFTITSHILSCIILIILSIYSTIALSFLWLVGTIWTYKLRTKFCTSKKLEFLYRAVVGVILTFTFFNVKGQNTKVAMTIYYIFHLIVDFVALLLLFLLKPELMTSPFYLTVSGIISGGSVLGLVCLVLYYTLLHPRGKCQEADEVDGLGRETQATKRIRNFLQPW